jgi:5-methyltetrahydrofolate--homocysteine methyltransferase
MNVILEKAVEFVDLREKLQSGFLFFDGAMGTYLQEQGLKLGELPESYNIEKPEIIYNIHKKFVEAGSDIITTNTFGANELKLEECGYSVEEVIGAAVNLARKAAGDDRYVALDLGPIGKLMEPAGMLSFDEAYELFKRQVKAGEKAGCDLFLIETISDIYEAKSAILAVKENSDLPVFCTVSFQEDGRTLMGTDPLTVVSVLEGLGVDALGVNCSLGPKELMPIVDKILEYSSIPVMVQPNAGLPKVENGKTVFDIDSETFSQYMEKMAESGVRVLGGCCGTKDDFIQKTVEKVSKLKTKEIEKKDITVVSSSTKSVVFDEVRVIGERINPTGKKKFKEALKNHDIDYILDQAIEQNEGGADLLDVNVGLPEIDEKAVMVEVIKELQTILHLPLQIDSSSPEVIEAGARIYNGKPLINSVNGKIEVMEDIFPIVKKYGACVIGLTLDENGIPSLAEDRFEIAKRIVDKAAEYGIDKKNIFIDCLVLTASAQQAEVKETLKALTMVKEKLGVKTALGVSNVSFGLPNRGILNRTFLSMAMQAGLDAPIMNPNTEEMMQTVFAYKVLANQDVDSEKYIQRYSNQVQSAQSMAATSGSEEKDLKEIVIKGLKEEAKNKTKELLKTETGLDIVKKYLIPALDIVGQRFEKGEIFLPQLIQSAETVKNSFIVIKEKLESEGAEKISKGKIILATVKGDIHDIGKNIVKVVLENYGFEIIDLGKDVPIEKVVETAKKEGVRLVGLSALMTTTVISMKETIEALKKEGVPCKVFVGGAVLNQEYADMIGADYYAKDAQESVRIAQEFFGSDL